MQTWGLVLSLWFRQLLDAFSCSAVTSSLICLDHSVLILYFILCSFFECKPSILPCLSSPFTSSYLTSWLYVLCTVSSRMSSYSNPSHLSTPVLLFCLGLPLLAYPSSSPRAVTACCPISPPHLYFRHSTHLLLTFACSYLLTSCIVLSLWCSHSVLASPGLLLSALFLSLTHLLRHPLPASFPKSPHLLSHSVIPPCLFP